MQQFFSFPAATSWLLIPACVCMLSVYSDDATQPKNSTQPTTEQNSDTQKLNGKECDGNCGRLACPVAQSKRNEAVAYNDDKANQQPNTPSSDSTNSSPDQAALVKRNENPNDSTQPPESIAQNTQGAENNEGAASTQEQPKDDMIKCEATISEKIGDGKSIVFDNGMSFEIPTVLKRKTASWQVGDKVLLEKGRRESWYRLYNQTRGEKIRARLQASNK